MLKPLKFDCKLFFLFLHKNLSQEYLLAVPHLGASTVDTYYTNLTEAFLMSTNKICFLWRNKKKYHYFVVENCTLAGLKRLLSF